MYIMYHKELFSHLLIATYFSFYLTYYLSFNSRMCFYLIYYIYCLLKCRKLLCIISYYLVNLYIGLYIRVKLHVITLAILEVWTVI